MGVLLAYCHNCSDYGIFRTSDIRTLAEIKDSLLHDAVIIEAMEHDPRATDVWVPEDITLNTEDWPDEARNWLSKYLDHEVVVTLGIGYSPSLGRVILPVRDNIGNICYWQGRNVFDIPKAPKYLNAKGVKKVYAYFPCFFPERCNDVVVLVEDYLSAAKVARHANSLCLFGKDFDGKHLPYHIDFKKMRAMVMLDGDDAGRAATHIVLRKAQMHFRDIGYFTLPIGHDPKDLSDTQLKAYTTSY
jgi:hypothetical protein